MLVFSKTNCSKPQKQKSSVFPTFWTLSNTFQTPVKRCPQKLNTKTKSPGKQRTSSFSERFFWHFNFRSLFQFYLIPPKTSRIFATFYPFQFNSTLFHPFQPFYVSLVNSHWDKSRGKWMANIRFQGKRYNLGRFDHIQDAIDAREAAEKAIFGDFLTWYEDNKGK